MPHSLQHRWLFYLHYPSFHMDAHRYSQQAYESLCGVHTVEEFWKAFEHLPTPSQVFATLDGGRPSRVVRPKVNGRVLEAIGMFKEGPLPEWEEPLNLKGGHWECRRNFPLVTLDRLWYELVLALVGEVLEEGRDIVGARVVDKSKSRSTEYRLEIWVSSTDPAVTQPIVDNALDLLREHDPSLDFVWKAHSDALHTAIHCGAATQDA
jgi:translation initiation factor 4E